MSNNEVKITTEQKQSIAVAKLIETGSVVEAAKAARVSKQTVHRWLSDPDLMAELNEYGVSVKRQGALSANLLVSEALETLQRNMTCKNPAIEVRSASVLLNLVYNNPYISNDEAEEAHRYVQVMRRVVARMPDSIKAEFMRELRFEEATQRVPTKTEVITHGEEVKTESVTPE